MADIWNATVRRSERQALLAVVARGGDATAINDAARAIFDRVRGRFWRAIRRSPEAMRIFREAGFSFPEEFVRDLGLSIGSPVPRRTLTQLRSSPPFVLPAHPPAAGARILFMDIDHLMRLSDRPNLSLSAHNLRLVSRIENQSVFESLRRMDTFGGAVPGGLRRGRRALITPPSGSAPLDTTPPDWDELMRQLDEWAP